MHTKHVLGNLVDDLDRISLIFCDLASSTEFQQKRDVYLHYHKSIVDMKEELQKDYGNVANYESYTGTLDRI